MTPRHIAIIGGGYSGTLQAINLLRYGNDRVTLIERTKRIARGAAYGTRHADHLLNVRAGKMSAFADAPNHFAAWLAERGHGDAASFAERRLYGLYLEELLANAASEAGERLRIVRDEAVSVASEAGGEIVRLASGGTISADAVILSVGNLPPDLPRAVAPGLDGDVYVADPWAGNIGAGLSKDDRLLLIGTGLTAIDAALMLDSSGFEGRIVAISRRGMVPRAHDRLPHDVPELAGLPAGSCAALTRFVRANAKRIGWQAAVDQLRPHTQALWASAPVEQRRRLLRHLRPYWDVHRHRIAPEIADRIAAMEREGRLSFQAGKLISATAKEMGARVLWRPRGSDEGQEFIARRIVNCTGPSGDVTRSGEALLDQLSNDGRIRPDPCRIGIDIDEGCHVIDAQGKASPTLYAVGPMTRGALWEIVAVPDLRIQTDGLARRIAGR